MKTSIQSVGPCRKKLRVEVPQDEVANMYESIAAVFVKQSEIKGFRRGKAPRALVEKHYARRMQESLKEDVARKFYRPAVEHEKIEPVAIIDVDEPDVVPGQPWAFTVTLDVPPEFKLPKYKGLSLKSSKIEVTDEDVAKRVNEMLEMHSRYEVVENRPVAAGDFVRVDFEGSIDGAPMSGIKELGASAKDVCARKDFWMLAGKSEFIPGFGEGLAGAELGRPCEISVTFPADYPVGSLGGKQAVYRASVTQIRARVIPALDADFLKAVEAESEEALRTRVRETLQKEAESKEEERLKETILKTLLAKTAIEVPESVVADEARRMFYARLRQGAMQGMSRDQLSEHASGLAESVKKSALDEVKIGYILHRIAEEEKIAVEDAEVDGAIARLAARYQTAPDAMRQDMEKNQRMDAIRNEIRMNKTLDFIFRSAALNSEGFFGRLISGISGKEPEAKPAVRNTESPGEKLT